MAEEPLGESFPDLKELESKVGRKTPESLLTWMRDAAEDGCWPEGGVAADHRTTFSDKLRSLRQEMRWLRSADVRILRQLMAVHEGIEAMRWLMADRGTLASRDSSLMGSLSSLVTPEEPGASGSPCRSPAQGDPHITTEVSAGGHPGCRSYRDGLSLESSEVRPPASSSSRPGVLHRPQASSHQHLEAFSSQDVKAGSDPIRRALLRSCMAARRGERALDLVQHSGAQEQQTPNNVTEEEEKVTDTEKVLLGYDTQWCWVESQDDVTYL